jgi:uncharacterized protein with PIN domain
MPDPAQVYDPMFRSLLWRVRAPRLQENVDRYHHRASERIAQSEPADRVYAEIYEQARSRVIRQLLRAWSARQDRAGRPAADHRGRQVESTLQSCIPPAVAAAAAPRGPDFHCDSGLGGLARWLRAAGYDARFWPGIDDDDLLQRACGDSAILLTTDRPLMQRGIVRWGAVAAMLVPLPGGKQHQFRYVADKLHLPRRPARCMGCGGELRRVPKESVRDRIPPRTYPFCDDYWLCSQCDRLLWTGTHWGRIEAILGRMG